MMTRMAAVLAAAFLPGVGPAGARARTHDALPSISFQRFVHHLRAQGYHPYRRLPAGRSDLHPNDFGDGAIRRRYPELAYCDGTGLNDCVFLFARAGRPIIEVQTNGERPADLVMASIERIDHDQAAKDDHDGCDIGPSPDTPCPR